MDQVKYMKTKMMVKNIRLSRNKSIEIQLDIFPQGNTTILQCEFRINQKTDHAGVGLFLLIYKLVYFHIQFYDHRHWDRRLKKWEERKVSRQPQEWDEYEAQV